jgi:hypothetical protein
MPTQDGVEQAYLAAIERWHGPDALETIHEAILLALRQAKGDETDEDFKHRLFKVVHRIHRHVVKAGGTSSRKKVHRAMRGPMPHTSGPKNPVEAQVIARESLRTVDRRAIDLVDGKPLSPQAVLSRRATLLGRQAKAQRITQMWRRLKYGHSGQARY